MGIYRERYVQVSPVRGSSTRRYCEQEWESGLEYRAPVRWDDSGSSSTSPAGGRSLAEGEWRVYLRHAPLEGLWRGADQGHRRIVSRHRHTVLHSRGFSLHYQKSRSLCNRAGLAFESRTLDPLAEKRDGWRGKRGFSRVAHGQCQAHVPAGYGWLASSSARECTREICVCFPDSVREWTLAGTRNYQSIGWPIEPRNQSSAACN